MTFDFILFLQFKRRRATQDSNDLPFSDTECQHFVYARGPLNGQGTEITRHSSTPVVSTNKVSFPISSTDDKCMHAWRAGLARIVTS